MPQDPTLNCSSPAMIAMEKLADDAVAELGLVKVGLGGATVRRRVNPNHALAYRTLDPGPFLALAKVSYLPAHRRTHTCGTAPRAF
jgi:hypothetical protein